MTQQVAELYTALIQVGVKEETARAAAKSVMAIEDKETLATKADLANLRLELLAEMQAMKVDIIKWNVVAMGLLTTLYAAINIALRFKP